MSRLFRPIHALFGLKRILSRLPAGQTVQVERVKIRRGRPATRFLGNVVKCVLVFQLVVYAASPLIAVEDDVKDDVEDDVEDDDHNHSRREADEEDQDPLFIPFPFTTRKILGQPYKRDSPEWQEFLRIYRDQQLQKRLKHQLVFVVMETLRRAPGLHPQFGKEMRCRNYMLHLDYPLRGPPEYERSGLLITDDAVEWTTQPCDPAQAAKLNRILWPKALALGLWASGKGAVMQTARDVAGWLGWDTGQTGAGAPKPPLPEPPSPEVEKVLQRIRQHATRRPAEVDDPSPTSPSAGVPPIVPSSSSPPDKTANVPSGNPQAPGERGWLRELVLSIAKTRPFRTGERTFLRETYRMTMPEIPRGAVVISGTIELASTKVAIPVDVLAFYNPKTGLLLALHIRVQRSHTA